MNGFLVPEGDAARLANRLDQLLTDESLRRRLGSEGARLASRYRWPCVADAILKLYAQFLPASGARLTRASRCESGSSRPS